MDGIACCRVVRYCGPARKVGAIPDGDGLRHFRYPLACRQHGRRRRHRLSSFGYTGHVYIYHIKKWYHSLISKSPSTFQAYHSNWIKFGLEDRERERETRQRESVREWRIFQEECETLEKRRTTAKVNRHMLLCGKLPIPRRAQYNTPEFIKPRANKVARFSFSFNQQLYITPGPPQQTLRDFLLIITASQKGETGLKKKKIQTTATDNVHNI